MPRHFSPTACLLLALMVGIASTCLAQSTTEVLYVKQNTDVITYDIDQTTLQATRVGKGLPVSGGPAAITQVVPTPNGHFVYVTSGPTYNQMTLTAYATDASGVPEQPPFESLGPAPISQFVVHPSGRFAYLITYTNNANLEFFYEMQLYTINPSTGYLTETQVHKFKPTYYCAPFIAGFYPDGSEMEYVWDCIYPENGPFSQQFFEQSVNSQTGEPGPAVSLFSVSDTDLSADEVKLAPKTINDFYQSFAPPETELRIYPFTTGPKKLLIGCTALMLSACVQADGFLQDVSGRYLFLELPSVLEIVKIDLSTDSIVDTGYSIPETDAYFSPDDAIIYGLNYQYGGVTRVQLYGFDAETGAVTVGERLDVGKNFSYMFPAQRR
jgi:hypothetical protein